jgi:magnesium-transporting ATPase (P-type)
VVHHGLVNDAQKVHLVNWALSYVQRYMYKMHPLKYVSFKELEKERLSQLKVVMAGKLHYKYCLNGLNSTSQDHFEASAILKVFLTFSFLLLLLLLITVLTFVITIAVLLVVSIMSLFFNNILYCFLFYVRCLLFSRDSLNL